MKKKNRIYNLIIFLVFTFLLIILFLKIDYNYSKEIYRNKCINDTKINELGGIDFSVRNNELSKIIIITRKDHGNITFMTGEKIKNEYYIKEQYNISPQSLINYPPFNNIYYEIKLKSFSNIKDKELFFLINNSNISQDIINKQAHFIKYYRISLMTAIKNYINELIIGGNTKVFNKSIQVFLIVFFSLMSLITLIYITIFYIF